MARTRKGSVPAGSSPLTAVNPFVISPPSSPSDLSPGFATPTTDSNFIAREKPQGFPWFLPSASARARLTGRSRPSPLKFVQGRRPSDEEDSEDDDDMGEGDNDDEDEEDDAVDSQQVKRMREEIAALTAQVEAMRSRRRMKWDAILWSVTLGISLTVLYLSFAR